MQRRIIIIFSIISFLSIALCVRIGFINTSDYDVRASESNTNRIALAQSRGYIYDRNYIPIVNNTTHREIAVNPTYSAVTFLKETLPFTEYSKIKENLENGFPTVCPTESYYESNSDIAEFEIVERYTNSDYAQNIIGYIDSENKGQFGIEKAFDTLLSKSSGTLKLDYSVSADGRALQGKSIKILDDNYNDKSGIVLTLDKNIQIICEDALKKFKIETGAAVVLDAKTSEILALVTAPSIDRNNLEKSLNDTNSPFINRALTSYSVGSVFKPIVSAVAIDSGIPTSYSYTCKGYTSIYSNNFNCHKKDGHGTVDMISATSQSCNCYFINLGLKVGPQKILALSQSLGLGKSIELCDCLSSESGNLTDISELNSDSAIANLSFGQGSLLATPLQISAVYASFANGGYYREPYLLKEMVDKNKTPTAYYKSEINNKVLADSTVKKIQSMLKETVENGLGKTAKPIYTTGAGKTATAETGWIRDGKEIYHTWFAGYFPAQEPKYVVVVMNENGNYSSTDCAPVFKEIADRITVLYNRIPPRK